MMKKFRKGDKVEVLVDTFFGEEIPKGTIGKVILHDKDHVEVDFNYKNTEARLSDDDSLSYWDIADGPMIHEKNLKLVTASINRH
ncbi:hypothetical protein P8822_00060 [Bacillus sonorensis]|uniref:hypothetical protein n=1 Tax=Bacillus sonorensis TaxID=119858 RepID=UPI002DBDA066|nr:hypothetical protein [Bacillus sonorensis]MEC0526207.1 hypothetical protein [Bacillus sonorensis]